MHWKNGIVSNFVLSFCKPNAKSRRCIFGKEDCCNRAYITLLNESSKAD
jgi:hypothetical protein